VPVRRDAASPIVDLSSASTLCVGIGVLTKQRPVVWRTMIRLKSLSFSIFGVSSEWEVSKQNKQVARYIIRSLEDRRLLFGPRGENPNDSMYCLASAKEIRSSLGDQLQGGNPGKALTQAIQEMRRAARRFMDKGGSDGVNFLQDRERFLVAVTELRITFGFYIAALASKYHIEIDEDLASILPPQADTEDPQDVLREY
jgi:hypothetical protein